MKALKKGLIFIGILAALILLLVVFVRLYLVVKESPNIREPESGERFDAIIVLGASVKPDRTPSDVLKCRLEKAYEMWAKGQADVIIVSGDHRAGEYDEVDVMYEYLAYDAHRVPEEKIIRDYQGFSTYESMYRASHYFDIQKAAVVTQNYHLYRALYTGDFYGLEVIGLEAESGAGTKDRLMRDLREWGACIKDFFYCITGREIPK